MSRLRVLGLNGKRVLDAGCGRGRYVLELALEFPDGQFHGVDVDGVALAQAAQLLRCRAGTAAVSFQTRSVLDPLGDSSYDVIYCVDVLEHVVDDARVILNFHKALRPGGALIVHVPLLGQKHYFPWFKNSKQHDHVRDGYDRTALEKMLERLGFAVQDARYTFGPVGALAWEIEATCHAINPLFRLAFAPIYLALCEIESRWQNRWGNGVLVAAQKRRT